MQQATAHPCLHQRLLDTHRQVWVSLLWGHCSFLLGPCAHKILFACSKSLFPQTCVSSGGSLVGLMATSSKRACAIPNTLFSIMYHIILLYYTLMADELKSHQNLNSDSAVYTLKIFIIPFKNVFQSVTLLLFNTHGLSSHSCHPYQ